MAKNDNRYIQFYTPGSAAVKVEVQKEQDWAPLPQWHKTPKKVIPVDPVAILGFVVAVCMLVLMAVGIQQLNTARQEVAVMERYVAQLTSGNNASDTVTITFKNNTINKGKQIDRDSYQHLALMACVDLDIK